MTHPAAVADGGEEAMHRVQGQPPLSASADGEEEARGAVWVRN